MENINNNNGNSGFALEKANYILLIIGFAIIIIGFMLMSGGTTNNPNDFYPNNDPNNTPIIFDFQHITLSTIIVLFGFVFEIFAIMANPNSKLLKKLFK